MVKTTIGRRGAHVTLLYNEETHTQTKVVPLIVLTSVGRKRFSHRVYIIIYVRVFTYNNNNIILADCRKYMYYTLMGERRRD